MLDFSQASFDYEPYPVGLIRPAIEPSLYERLSASYPDKALFEWKPKLGNKYSLSELSHAEQYHRFIAGSPDWKRFHAYVKGPDFVPQMLEFLKERHIDIGLRRYRVVSGKARNEGAGLWNRIKRRDEISARFEFSMMGADGGHIMPHTDLPEKLITLVFSMVQPGEWNDAWGGGTDVVLPRDRSRIYNHMNRYMTFDDVDVLKTWAFGPNQCLVFVKTFNSWHSVSPMRGTGIDAMRKTLTINIESKR